ncbi:hypothetical protein HG531_005334 [Fusarium graminearum]|nr:hypothetical protein HG531_005334 [Fusarium graminearum]
MAGGSWLWLLSRDPTLNVDTEEVLDPRRDPLVVRLIRERACGSTPFSRWMLRGRSFEGDVCWVSSAITSFTTSFLCDDGRIDAAGRFPRAFSLITGRSFTTPLLWPLVGWSRSTVVRVLCGAGCCRAALRDPPDVPNPVSRIRGSAVEVDFFDGDIFLLARGEEGVNFWGGIVVFFIGEAVTYAGASEAVAAVLPDEGISSSSADSWGDTKRAVGRGPDADGPRTFFKIGWVGGGFEALEDRVLNAESVGLDERDPCGCGRGGVA